MLTKPYKFRYNPKFIDKNSPTLFMAQKKEQKIIEIYSIINPRLFPKQKPVNHNQMIFNILLITQKRDYHVLILEKKYSTIK